MSTVVGIDLGGTKLAAVLVDCAGAVRHRIWHEHRITGYPAAIAAVTSAVRECAESAGAGAAEVSAVGLAVAGPLDRDRDRVLAALNLGFADQPLRRDLAERLGVPVAMENDANAAALAEHRRGAGAGARCMVLLTLGTGIGGGIVLNGRLLVGANGAAAELGHLPVVPDGHPCGCGGHGCLEQYASGTALAARAGPLLPAARSGPFTSRDVVAAAQSGDPEAIGLLREAGKMIGGAVVMLAPAIDPDVVVVGGGLAHAAADHLIPTIRATLECGWPFRHQNGPATVRLSACGPDGGALGAAELARAAVRR